jgi:hypothetical protein
MLRVFFVFKKSLTFFLPILILVTKIINKFFQTWIFKTQETLYIMNNIFKSWILKMEKNFFHRKIKIYSIQKSKTFKELQKMKKNLLYLQVLLVIPTHNVVLI